MTEPAVVRLYEIADIDVDNARLVYQASLRTDSVEGRIYLEMLCDFPGKGEFFSRGVETSLTGTSDWVDEEIPFLLKKGERPQSIKLNLVIEGKGTVWVDDVHLLKEPL